jgi:hypothetical protein
MLAIVPEVESELGLHPVKGVYSTCLLTYVHKKL